MTKTFNIKISIISTCCTKQNYVKERKTKEEQAKEHCDKDRQALNADGLGECNEP